MIRHLPFAKTRTPVLRAIALRSLSIVVFGAFATPISPPLAAQERVDVAAIERIKAEEMNHSQIMDLMSWLSDVYGPRLTWSPNLSRAGDWAMGQMKSWGLTNVHEERWDNPPGLGWENERFSLMATGPTPFIVEAVPQAWSPSTNGTASGPAVLVEAGCSDELRAQYVGKLKGAFVLTTPPLNRAVNDFAATARRLSDSALTAMAAAQPSGGGRGGRGGGGRGGGPAPARSAICERQAARDSAAAALAGRGGRGGFVGRGGLNLGDTTTLRWLEGQGVAGILLGDVSHVGGDIGTNNGASRVTGAPRVPTVHVAQESYGRIARMLQKKVARHARARHAEQVLPAEHVVVQRHRRDSRHRSPPQGRGGDDRRAFRLVAFRHGSHRQRRGLRSHAGSHATASARSTSSRGARFGSPSGPAKSKAYSAPAPTCSSTSGRATPAAFIRPTSSANSPPTSTSTTAAARFAASTFKRSKPSVPSSTRGWHHSRISV